MAKKKKKADGKAAKLPKRIAGVKVPKQLREPGGKLLEAVSNPLLIDMAAAALLAAASGLRDGRRRAARPGEGAAAPSSSAEPSAAGPVSSEGASKLGSLIAAAAVDGLRKMAESKRPGERANGGGRDRGE